jgi:WD40 repeat protein
VRSNSQQPVERQVESYFATSSKPFLIPSVFEWSKDGIHIYYSHTFTGADGCYPSDYSNLMKFNIITGEVTEVLNGRASEFSLSPDETQLAYNANWGRVITMRDLKTRNEYDIEPPKQFADMPYAMSTSFAWSSDGGFLAYTFVDDPCWVAETNAVVLVNTFSHQQKVLVVKTDRMPLWVERFLNDNAILLQDWEGHYWIVDIQTLELTQVK